jgi:hypothetical protein
VNLTTGMDLLEKRKICKAVESESEGILGGVGIGKNVRIATVTIRLILKYRL